MSDMELQKQMIKAAKNADNAAINKLVKQDKNLLNSRDKDDSTPLHCAAWKGFPETVKLLLELGADVNAVNKNDHYGDTPLHAAAHGNQKAVAEILVAHGANINAKNPAGKTPIDETKVHKATAVEKYLKSLG